MPAVKGDQLAFTRGRLGASLRRGKTAAQATDATLINDGLLEFEHELVGLAADIVLEHPLGAVVAGKCRSCLRHQLEAAASTSFLTVIP